MSFDVEEYVKERRKKQTNNTETKTTDRESFDVEEYIKQRRVPEVAETISSRFQNWLSDYDGLAKDYSSRYKDMDASTYRSDSTDWLSNISSRVESNKQAALEIKDIVEQYKDYLDPEWVSNFNTALLNAGKSRKEMLSGAEKENKYWSQWESEDAYYDDCFGSKYIGKTYTEVKEASQNTEGKEAEWLTNNADYFMTSAEAQAEIDNLNHYISLYDNGLSIAEDRINAIQNGRNDVGFTLDELVTQVTELRSARDGFAKKKAHYIEIKGSATRREEKEAFITAFLPSELNPEIEMPDFDEYVKKGEEYGLQYTTSTVTGGGYKVEIKNYNSPLVARKHGIIDSASTTNMGAFAENIEENEYNNYLYLLGKHGKKVADKYLEHLEEALNTREAEKIAKDTNAFEAMFYAAYAGLDQFGQGVQSLFSNEEYITPSTAQIASGKIREQLKDNGIPFFNLKTGKWEDWDVNIFGSSAGQLMYDAINTTSNMLPSVLASAGANLIAPGSGAFVGATLMGTSAAGHAKAELLNLGYSKAQANAYGLMVGASEALLERFIGGITSFGGSSAGLTKHILSKVDNTFARVAISLGGSMLSEGFEEGLQTVIEPWLKEIATGVDWESPDIDEILYSSLLGALSALGLEGGGTVVSEVQRSNAIKNTGKSILAINGGYDALKTLANEVSSEGLAKGETNIGKLVDKAQVGVDAINDGKAGKRQINKTAKNVGILSEAVNSVRNEQNLAEIQSVLESKGLDSSKAKTSAELLNRLLYDNELTKAEYKALMSDERVYDTYRELVSSSQSTLKSRNTKHTLGRMGIITNADGTHSVMEIPNKKAGASAVESSEAKNAGVKSNYTVSSDGVTRMIDGEEAVEIVDIVSIDGGGVTVKLSNGKKVNAADVSFASEAEAQLYSELSSYTGDNIYDIHPSIAKGIISSYDPSSDISPEEYLKAAAIAYTYGKYNIPQREIPAGLSDAQKNHIYKLGQTFTENRVKQDEKRIRKQIAYSFKQYSDHQLENWKDSKTIIPYENQRQLSEFIDKSLSDNGYNKKIYFGQINDDLARRIKNEFGVSVDNYNCVLRADEVRKILKNSHGNQTNEELRGQRQIKKEDIMDIPLIIQNPDSIELSPKQFEGKPVLIFRKELHGKETVVAYVSKKHMDLTVQTMYSGKEKSHSTTPIGNNTLSHTSETLSVKAFSNNMVSQNEPYVNSSNMQENAKNTGRLIIEKGVKAVHESQKIALRVLTLLAERLGLTIHVYKSDMVDGERVYKRPDGTVVSGKNGWYDTKTSEIWLDINAGTTGQGLILFTASHELVHFIRQWSHAKFKILADFLMDKYGEAGKSVDDLIHQQMSSRGIEYGEAYEEVVASSMEAMLKDGKVLEKLAELEKEDHGIVQKIRTFLKNFADKLRAVYRDIDPATEEGQFFAEMTEEADRIAQMFAEALHDAGENFKKTDVSKFETSEEVKYSAVGPKSKTADLSVLEAAIQRIERGVPASQVRKYLGWWQGKDGKWRYEISDKDMDFRREGFVKNPKYLSDYVNHHRLFESYPELKKVAVKFVDKVGDSHTARGLCVYDKAKTTIYIKSGLSNQSTKETLLHEMQHAVQRIEGFKTGSSKKTGGLYLFNDVYSKVKDLEEYKNLKTADQRRTFVLKAAEIIYGDTFDNLSIQQYFDDHGEIEARKTVERMGMSDDELRANQYFNDGIEFNRQELKKVSVDNFVKMGYTKNKAQQIVEKGAYYDYKQKNDDKSSATRRLRDPDELGQDGSGGRNVETNNDRGTRPEREIYGAVEISDIDAVANLESGSLQQRRRTLSEEFASGISVDEKYSSASTDVSTRGLLVNALESAAQTDAEREKLAKYKAKISEIEALEQRIDELVEEKRKLRADKENADAIKLREIQDEIIKTTNRIDIADKQLLRLEVAKELQNIVERQRKAAYSYEKLVQKEDLKIPQINNIEEREIKRYKADKNLFAKNMRALVARQNNAKNSATSVFLHCDDLNADIQITRDSFKHGAARMDSAYISICSSLSDILKNSIVVNELRNREGTNGSYVLLSLAENSDSYVIVRSVVNKKTWKLEDYNELYAVRKKSIKKEDAGFKPPHYIQENGYGTSSTISISDFLEFVNSEKLGSGVLSESVIERLGYERKSDAILTPELKYSDRGGEDVSTRGLLVNALESAAQTDAEREKLSKYKAKIAEVEALERKLEDINRQIRQITFGKGPKDMDKLRSLQDEKIKTTNRIDIADKQLLRLEVAKELQNIVERQRSAAYAKAKEVAKQHRKEADERREKTLRRNQIRKTVDDLNRLLTRPTKEKHVPIWLQKPVAEFLSAIDQDNDSKIAYYDAKVKKFSEELEALEANPQADPAVIQEVKLRLANAQARGFKTVEHLRAIKAAYDKIFESKDPVISNAFHPEVSEKLEEIVSMIGQNVPLSTMSLSELDQVFQAVKIVENVVRNANKFFAEGQKQTITETAKAIDNEVLRNRQKIKERIKAVEGIKGLTFTNNLKPLTLAKVIGSDTFTALLERMIDSENTWAVDQWQAKQYYEKIATKTGAKSWELEARREVTLGGEKVSLSLGQIMSLYALSRRKQAVKHLTEGGFVDGEDQVFYKRHKLKVLELEVNALRPTRITVKELADIGKLLTEKQVEFVREMQSYLSTTMANKGNESSRAMYGIDLFGEPFYFPIKSKQSFLAEEKRNADGKNRTKNLGMTKQTTPGANNPVVLSDFMNVWTKHINDMALYHSVTTVEDFSRVWNSKYAELDGGTPKTLKDTVTTVCGKNVGKYIDKLIVDANAGIRAQDRDLEKIEKLTSRTKKAAVYLSASVTIQQISAVERAKAYIPERYFLKSIFEQFKKGHKASWEEMKRYCPVAIIKEMGGYDLTGANTRQWMMGAKGTVAKIDEKLGGFPAKMDELAWCAIWEAGKNMTASLRGEHGEVLYEKGSEAFYKKASEIVTEAIRHTQVYDSIFVRSAHMRSNSQYAKALTAFMAEPTTSFNMYIEAMIDFKRGGEIRTAGRKVNAKVFAIQLATGVVRASIGAALAAALIHAMRDDDEEKTFAEKYAGHAVVDVIDNLTVFNMIPVVKDYFSITQGYGVARPDVQLFEDAWRAYNALDSGELSTGQKIVDIVATISSFTPIPLKNLKRDAVGLYNTLFNSVPLSKTTWLGVKEAVSEEISGKEESNSDLLYEAMIGGSKKEIGRIKARFNGDSQIQSAIRKGLRENDPRIREAAMLNIKGDMKGYAEIVNEIASEKIFEKDRIIEAVNLEINAINRESKVTDNEPIDEDETVTSLFNASMLNRTLDSGDTETALEMIDDMVNAKVKSGKTEQEAKSAIKSNVTRYWKEKYIAAWRAGDDEEMVRIRKLLTETNLYGGAYKVSTTVRDWLKEAAGK